MVQIRYLALIPLLFFSQSYKVQGQETKTITTTITTTTTTTTTVIKSNEQTSKTESESKGQTNKIGPESIEPTSKKESDSIDQTNREEPESESNDKSTETTQEGNPDERNKTLDEKVSEVFQNEQDIIKYLDADRNLVVHDKTVKNLADNISVSQKFRIYNDFKKEGGLAFIINFFIPFGLGSFLQGDSTGGWTGLLGEGGSIAVILISQFTVGSMYYTTGNPDYSLANNIIMTAASLSAIGFWIYGVIRPWVFSKKYNEKLAEVLKLAESIQPWINIAMIENKPEPVYGFRYVTRF